MAEEVKSIFSDLSKLAIKQDFNGVKVKNLITTVSVRTSPDKAWFFRTNTDVNYSLDAGLLVQKDEGKIYFVIPSLLADETVTGFIKPYQIRTCITRQSQPFLWALRLQTSDKTDNWATSALAAAGYAEKSWIRVQADMHQGSYIASQAIGNFPEPTWPEKSFNELLELAFKGRIIDKSDHPVLRQLRGEE